jgi:hypothetical protein
LSAKVDVKTNPNPRHSPNTGGTDVARHYVSNSLKPLRVKDAAGCIRVVKYGEYIPEATDWKSNIQAANVRMGVLRQVEAPPAGYKPAKVEAPPAEKKAKPKADDDPMFDGATK